MRPTILLAAIALLLGAPAEPAARGLQVEDLLAMHVDWRGGREALAAIDFLERRGSITIGGQEGTFRTVASAAGYARTDVRLPQVQQAEAITPHGGWRWANGNNADLDDERIAAHRASLDQLFFRHLLGGAGYEATDLGSENHEGQSYRVLRLADGERRIDMFLDPQNAALQWTREPGGDAIVWTKLDDWRWVDGVRYAFRSDRRPDGPGRRQLSVWEEIITRGEVDPSQFFRPPEQSGTLAFDDAIESAPFDFFLDGYIQLDGGVDGHAARVMLDSGAGITVLDSRFAAQLGLETRPAGTVRGIGGRARLSLADNVTVTVPGVALLDATVAVLDLSEIADVLGREFHVILGVEVFTRAVVAINYPARRVSFSPPGSYEPPASASSARMFSRAGVPKIPCRFEQLPETMCDIDTGSSGTIDIVAHYVDEHDLLEGRQPVSRVATGGVGGMFDTPIATLADFEFAGVSVGSSPALFMDDAIGSLDTEEIAGNIGTGLFGSFVLVFDYPAMRFHVMTPATMEPVRRDRTGVQVSYRGDHLEVFHVAPGSPAEAAGLEAGQRITAIDGRRIGLDYLDGLFRWRHGPAGSELELTDDLGRRYRIVLADYF